MATHKDLKRAYKDPSRCKTMWQQWYAKNKERVNARKRGETPKRIALARQSDAEYRRRALARVRLQKYGVSAEQYQGMHVAQCGLCAICCRPETARNRNGGTRSLSVDHDHQTGQVRGLLCTRCNAALGHAQDDILILRAAISYLESHNG